MLALALAGCGSGSYSVGGIYKDPSGKTTGMKAGNWIITTTSNVGTGSGGSFLPIVIAWEGPVTTSSNSVSMAAYTSADNWSGNPNYGDTVLARRLTLTGAESGNAIQFSIAAAPGLTIHLTGTVASGVNISGTYTATATQAGSDQARSFSGTFNGVYVAPITGYWEGTMKETRQDLSGVALSSNSTYTLLTLTQSTTPVTLADCANCGPTSVYPVSGTAYFLSSQCYESGPIDPGKSYIVGGTLNLVVKAADGRYFTLPQNASPSLDPTDPLTLNFNWGSLGAATTYQIFTPLCPNDQTYQNFEQIQVDSVITPLGPS